MQVGFKILSIENGWFKMWIGPGYVIEGSDYLGYDLPKEFLCKAFIVLQEDGKEEWLYIMGEPRCEIMRLWNCAGKIHMAVYPLTKDCFHLSRKEEDEKDNCGECSFRQEWKTEDFVDTLVSEFYLYENGNGRGLYETHWMPFPDEEYEILKKLAFEIDKKAQKYGKLYCIDTMCPQRLALPYR